MKPRRFVQLPWMARICGSVLLVVAGAGLAQKPPNPPAPPWKDFVKAAGHDIEIPAQWVETPEGRFAHAIVLPPSIPKTVPFDFAMARLRALKPGGHSVARQYRDHLCSTEAGSFILKAVENVDGFFFRRPLHGATEDENNDRWKLEAPGVQAIWQLIDDPPDTAKMFVDPPSATYEWVDVRAENDAIYRYSGLWSRASPPNVPPMRASSARSGGNATVNSRFPESSG
jgi:hypothetical protein